MKKFSLLACDHLLINSWWEFNLLRTYLVIHQRLIEMFNLMKTLEEDVELSRLQSQCDYISSWGAHERLDQISGRYI